MDGASQVRNYKAEVTVGKSRIKPKNKTKCSQGRDQQTPSQEQMSLKNQTVSVPN